MMLEKRSFSLSGHRTSVALEPEFWAVLERMAAGAGTLSAVVGRVDDARAGTGERLASALRVAVLTFLQGGGAQVTAGPKSGPHSRENEACLAALPPAAPPAR